MYNSNGQLRMIGPGELKPDVAAREGVIDPN
jgi:hypothetical protein